MKKQKICTLISLLLIATVLMLSACGQKSEPVKVTLDKTSLSMTAGESVTLKATVSKEGVTPTWSSSDETVATVVNGKVTAIAAGTATITATAEDGSAACKVTVAEAPKVNVSISEEEGYDGEISIFMGAANADLLEGLSAADDNGKSCEVTVADDGGFDVNKIGAYTITYKAVGEDGGEATFTRTAYVTYFGVNLDMITSKEASGLNSWTYAVDNDADKTAMEWRQHVVPGHSTNWNRFEGPAGIPYLVMHGSDTNGREVGSAEVDDENPNTMLWNKVTVPADNATLRVFCSNNPYPDYNNLLSKVRATVLDLETMTFTTLSDYREIKAPINETGDGLDYDFIRYKTYQDFDLSAFAGKTVVVFIEQDAPANVYQWDYYLDIGYLEFQIQPLVAETRDTLVIYSMQFVKGSIAQGVAGLTEEIWKGMEVDSSSVWGTNDEDGGTWGLRGDLTALDKWKWYPAEGINTFHNPGTQFIAWATGPDTCNDGIAEAVFANKVAINAPRFLLNVGCDTDANYINIRVSVVKEDGVIEILAPAKFVENEYVPGNDGWGTVHKSQWVYGTQIEYDFSAYVGENVTILIEQDAYNEVNPTIWLCKIELAEKAEVVEPAE